MTNTLDRSEKTGQSNITEPAGGCRLMQLPQKGHIWATFCSVSGLPESGYETDRAYYFHQGQCSSAPCICNRKECMYFNIPCLKTFVIPPTVIWVDFPKSTNYTVGIIDFVLKTYFGNVTNIRCVLLH